MTDENRAELLMDHYKDTFGHVLYHWKARNRLFIYILVLLAVLTVDIAQKGLLTWAVNQWLVKAFPSQQERDNQEKKPAGQGLNTEPKKQSGARADKAGTEAPPTEQGDGAKPGEQSGAQADKAGTEAPATGQDDGAKPGEQSGAQAGNIETKGESRGSGGPHGGEAHRKDIPSYVVDLLVWFLLLCVVARYYQRSIHVDRQYSYLDGLERRLCTLMGSDCITREGRAYLSRKGTYDPGEAQDGDDRPVYLRTIGSVYVYVFPALLSVFVVARFFLVSFQSESAHWLSVAMGIAMGLAILMCNGYYLLWARFRR